ncbi:MAG: hypothetical protein UT03_C0041G0005 [Candidatus Moranbacteria bacterium GW2011_GWD2_38_7]|nr:MAG: hypothetical protein UT03_C0041G0005 [Candidatus Moranbacteria bacterium GW2011_GWD2_38_7]
MKKPIVAGPVIVEEGRVLLVQAGKDEFWKFPGGKMESFENHPAEPTYREPKEELGIEIAILEPTPFIFRKKNVVLYHYLSLRLTEIAGGTAREWKWFSIEELEKYALAENVMPALKHFRFI